MNLFIVTISCIVWWALYKHFNVIIYRFSETAPHIKERFKDVESIGKRERWEVSKTRKGDFGTKEQFSQITKTMSW